MEKLSVEEKLVKKYQGNVLYVKQLIEQDILEQNLRGYLNLFEWIYYSWLKFIRRYLSDVDYRKKMLSFVKNKVELIHCREQNNLFGIKMKGKTRWYTYDMEGHELCRMLFADNPTLELALACYKDWKDSGEWIDEWLNKTMYADYFN